MGRLKKLIREKRGSYSLLIVTLTFIGVLVVTFAVDILYKDWALTELQGTLDLIGLSGLLKGVNENELRMERLWVDHAIARGYVLRTSKQFIKVGGNSPITYFEINPGDIEITNHVLHTLSSGVTIDNRDAWGFSDNKKRDYVMIRIVARARVKQSWWDKFPGVTQRFYDSRRNQHLQVTFNGVTDNGEAEIIIRSVSRIVLK